MILFLLQFIFSSLNHSMTWVDADALLILSGNSKINSNGSLNYVPQPNIKDGPSTKEAMRVACRTLKPVCGDGSRDYSLLTMNAKKRVDAGHFKTFNDISSRHNNRNQGADVSGVNSTKDATSTRTPSAERLRQPMPCQGRKELISFVQEALQGPNHEIVRAPASQRKRVAAPLGKPDRRLVYLSPMPLSSNGIAVAGAGLLKSRGMWFIFVIQKVCFGIFIKEVYCLQSTSFQSLRKLYTRTIYPQISDYLSIESHHECYGQQASLSQGLGHTWLDLQIIECTAHFWGCQLDNSYCMLNGSFYFIELPSTRINTLDLQKGVPAELLGWRLVFWTKMLFLLIKHIWFPHIIIFLLF